MKTKQFSNSFLRYTNCWEDGDLLHRALQPMPGDKILSIASAGDNSFSLLINDPQYVIAADTNLIQLHLVELKKAAFIHLDHSEFLSFLGFKCSDNRQEIYQLLKQSLSQQAQFYWSQNINRIEKGIIHEGKFEKYLILFRKKILPLIHSKKNIQNLLADDPIEKKKEFYYKEWNTWRWRFFFKIFFSRTVMGYLGRSPAFLKEVEISVGDYILNKSEQYLNAESSRDNYFLHYIFLGNFKQMLPHYAREENFIKIKSNADKLLLYHGPVHVAARKYRYCTSFNLSNIFEYMDNNTFTYIAKELTENAAIHARFAYWNLMVNRKMHDINEGLINILVPDRQEDKGFFYNAFYLNKKK